MALGMFLVAAALTASVESRDIVARKLIRAEPALQPEPLQVGDSDGVLEGVWSAGGALSITVSQIGKAVSGKETTTGSYGSGTVANGAITWTWPPASQWAGTQTGTLAGNGNSINWANGGQWTRANLAPTPPTCPPTKEPTKKPTPEPTDFPTKHPTKDPTNIPSKVPTDKPTAVPTAVPPTREPTDEPTGVPTDLPTVTPTTPEPTDKPTRVPTKEPTDTPKPTKVPTKVPTALPPTKSPTAVPPTKEPTAKPTDAPTKDPTAPPTRAPTDMPTPEPPKPCPGDVARAKTAKAADHTAKACVVAAGKYCAIYKHVTGSPGIQNANECLTLIKTQCPECLYFSYRTSNGACHKGSGSDGTCSTWKTAGGSDINVYEDCAAPAQ